MKKIMFRIGLCIGVLMMIPLLVLIPIMATVTGGGSERGRVNEYKDYKDETLDNRVPLLEYATISHEITSDYGPRAFYLEDGTWYEDFHTGTDFTCRLGEPIKATATGIVVVASYHEINGNYIRIAHGQDVVTYYGHLSKIKVVEGQAVFKGNEIGECGSTGLSTGTHLHFQLEVDKKPVWIVPYLKAGEVKEIEPGN